MRRNPSGKKGPRESRESNSMFHVGNSKPHQTERKPTIYHRGKVAVMSAKSISDPDHFETEAGLKDQSPGHILLQRITSLVIGFYDIAKYLGL
jgi:hypothetical protein